jgi:hypothetical protein
MELMPELREFTNNKIGERKMIKEMIDLGGKDWKKADKNGNEMHRIYFGAKAMYAFIGVNQRQDQHGIYRWYKGEKLLSNELGESIKEYLKELKVYYDYRRDGIVAKTEDEDGPFSLSADMQTKIVATVKKHIMDARNIGETEPITASKTVVKDPVKPAKVIETIIDDDNDLEHDIVPEDSKDDLPF